MAPRLQSSAQIWKLARDLGLKVGADPIQAVLAHCDRQIVAFLKTLPGASTLSELLELAVGCLGTTFEVVRSAQDIETIKQKYTARGEKIFANLERELPGHVFGVTFKRLSREDWERPYVSVIDCRGDKAAREFFTKWHELSHLLVLTDQLRLSFQRTHASEAEKDPEESLVDTIAGRFAFYAPFIQPHATGRISFSRIDDLRSLLCPEASRESSLNGFIAAWPSPCILLRGELRLRKSEERAEGQGTFAYVSRPQPVLRAVRVSPNDAARSKGIRIHRGMRIPERSIISRVFAGDMPWGEADEDLAWWETSDGGALEALSVHVEARRSWDGVEAILQPLP